MKRIIAVLIIVLIVAMIVAGYKMFKTDTPQIVVASFEECVAAGNPVMESYPRQCRNGAQTFIEEIGNELEKTDMIRVDSPRPSQGISSPLVVKGEARGNWFFEASFPVELVNSNGSVVAQGIATAQGDWMTADFVPFEATLTFTLSEDLKNDRGTLILHKDNPSGLPENDDSLEIPVVFTGPTNDPFPIHRACTQEAKLCPDGSYVGRTGENCEFEKCPGL